MAKDTKKETKEVNKTFVLSDESVNCYGFRVLTAGIDLTNFKNNPIMLWAHTRSWCDKTDTILPIGKWDNVRIEAGKLMGDAVFDMDDDFAAKIAKKVEGGFIKACSIGFEVLEKSDLPEHITIGQTRSTVTRCKLIEVSITDIPANANAVTLYDDSGKIIELTAESADCVIGLINNKNENNQGMKLIALKLGLSENATEAEILAKLQDLHNVFYG
jgi:HK97 family phage prohead protease